MTTYTPNPISTEGVELSQDLLRLTEQIAANVHEIWSAGRLAGGWQYGECRDDRRKLHPCLVPYDRLPESEKDYDRNTAMETLKLIQKLGFEIKKEEGSEQ
ncbi:MAG: Ryanodine receptor Ryr [Tannerella sp.]|jgi:ryanodine receptor 2|nr:Ryanodine receptor Ryr [Tannerella sp.]